jgi:transcriptional regulator with XRE-family HTH domain
MAEADLNNETKEQKYITQKEMAARFRKTEGTIINWRRKGYFTYFRPPDSKTVLYLLESVEDFEDNFTVISNRKEVDNRPKLVKREKPVVSAQKEWRI